MSAISRHYRKIEKRYFKLHPKEPVNQFYAILRWLQGGDNFMTLSRFAAFVIGLILAVFGLSELIQNFGNWFYMLISGILLIGGIWILLGLPVGI